MIYVSLLNTDLYTSVFSLAPGSCLLPTPELFRQGPACFPSVPPFRKAVVCPILSRGYFCSFCWDSTFLKSNGFIWNTLSFKQKRWYKHANLNQVSSSSLFYVYYCDGKKSLHAFPLVVRLSSSFYQGDFLRLTWMLLGSSSRQRFC